MKWVHVTPPFGESWPHGCCNAFVDGTCCGWPRRADGSCPDGHPAKPSDAPERSISDLRAAMRVSTLSSGPPAD